MEQSTKTFTLVVIILVLAIIVFNFIDFNFTGLSSLQTDLNICSQNTCDKNSGFTSDNHCLGNNIYKEYKECKCTSDTKCVCTKQQKLISNCPSDNSCVNGQCLECTDTCPFLGATICATTKISNKIYNATKTCGNYDQDACLEWGELKACTTKYYGLCNKGKCSSCIDECNSVGQKSCIRTATSSYAKTCNTNKYNSCLTWTYEKCPSDKTCNNGACI